MKKYYLLILILLFTFSSVYSQSARPIAAVKNTAGIVKLQKAGNGKFGSVEIGTLLYDGDRLLTEKFAMVAILFIDGSMLKVKELSDVTLNTESTGENKIDTMIDLPLGELWAKVTRRESKFEIHTPSSVASVKGTEFAVDVDQTGNSSLLVFSGKVEFGNELGSVLVKKNRKSTANMDEPPGEPTKMSSAEKDSDDSFNIPKESKWNMQINLPEDKQTAGIPFRAELLALGSDTKMLDTKCSTNIAISSKSASTLFSLDNKSWSEEINTTLTKGKLQFFVKSNEEGDAELMVLGSECASAKASVAVSLSEEQRNRIKAKILQVLKEAGVKGLDELEYTGSKIMKNFDLEDILDKIISGDLVVDTYEIEEEEGGEKKIAVQIKPAEE